MTSISLELQPTTTRTTRCYEETQRTFVQALLSSASHAGQPPHYPSDRDCQTDGRPIRPTISSSRAHWT